MTGHHSAILFRSGALFHFYGDLMYIEDAFRFVDRVAYWIQHPQDCRLLIESINKVLDNARYDATVVDWESEGGSYATV